MLTLTVHCILIKAKDLKTEGTQSVLQGSKFAHFTGRNERGIQLAESGT